MWLFVVRVVNSIGFDFDLNNKKELSLVTGKKIITLLQQKE